MNPVSGSSVIMVSDYGKLKFLKNCLESMAYDFESLFTKESDM